MDIWSLLSKSFAGNKTVAVTDFNGIQILYEDLPQYVNYIAENIIRASKPGGRLAVMADDPILEAVFLLSGLAAGCAVIPTSYKYGAKLCEQIISISKPSAILTDKSLDSEITKLLDKNAAVLEVHELSRSVESPAVSINDTSVALIMFTSGTTGVPKGVMLTHRNVTSNILAISKYFEITNNDAILIARPLYHAAVLTGELFTGLYKGLTISFYKEDFSPLRLLGFMSANRVTVLCGTPTMFNFLAYYAPRFKTDLRCAAISGEILTTNVAKKIADAFPRTIFYHVYGLTEASPRVAYLEPSLFTEKLCSIGMPIDGVEARIIEEDGGYTTDVTGELAIRGPNVMNGYLDDIVSTNRKIIGGWLHTGDMAYADGDGYLYVLGRKDNMIIRAGVNIYPQEIEDALYSAPGVSEALVYGEYDEQYGQRIVAEVVLLGSVDKAAILQACRDNLPEYKWPSDIRVVKELAKSPTGKVLRKPEVQVDSNG